MMNFLLNKRLNFLAPYAKLDKHIWFYLSVSSLNAIPSVVIVFLPLYLTTQLEFSILMMGGIMACYGGGQIIGACLGGEFIARYRLANFLIYNHLIRLGLTGCLMFLDTSFYIISTVISLGIIEATFRPALSTELYSQVSADARAQVNGLNRLLLNGIMGASLAIAALLLTLDFYWLFITAIIGLLVNLIIIILGKRKQLFFEPKTSETTAAVDSESLVHWHRLLQNRTFLLLCLVVIFNNFSFSQLHTLYPIYLQEQFAIDAATFGGLLTMNTVLIVIFQLPLLAYIKHFNRYYSAAFGVLCLAFGGSILLLGNDIFWVFVSVTIWTLGEILSFALIFSLVFDTIGERNQGRYLGFYYMLIAATSSLAPLLGSWIYDSHSGTHLWLSCLIGGILSALILVYLHKRATFNDRHQAERELKEGA